MRNIFNRIALVCLIVFATSCRTDKPPQISVICTLDGFGGGDCVQADGTSVYMAPSQMKNFWATTQTDEANFASWCYKVPSATTFNVMDKLKSRMLTARLDGGKPEPLSEILGQPRGAREE